jgi:transcriptional regulator with XRE-family HTH domain
VSGDEDGPGELAPFRHTLADLLATLRREADLTQKQVADRLGYSRGTVAGAETGQRQPGKEFWTRADDLLARGGELRAAYAQLAAARQEHARQRAHHAEVEREARIARWRAANNLPAEPAAAAARPRIDPAMARGARQHTSDPDLTDDEDAALSVLALRWLVAPSQTPAGQASGWRRVGQVDVERLRAMRGSLKALDDSHGGGTALPMVSAYLRCEAAPLLRGSYSESVGQGLLDATAKLLLTTAQLARLVQASTASAASKRASCSSPTTSGRRRPNGSAPPGRLRPGGRRVNELPRYSTQGAPAARRPDALDARSGWHALGRPPPYGQTHR